MAGTRSAYRIARMLLITLAVVLSAGVVGSLAMGVRATNQARTAAADQARSIVENSLPLVLSPSDVAFPASDTRADLITEHITPVVLDPTTYDVVTIWSTEGTIVYATDRSLIGQRPEESRTIVRNATTEGTTTIEQHDGFFSVLLPLRLHDGQISAAVELSRPDDQIVAAARPWNYNAVLLFIVLAFVGFVLYRVMRLASSSATPGFFTSNRVAPAAAPMARPMELSAHAVLEEAEARRKAQERAEEAEARLKMIQEQYQKSIEELHITQRLLREQPQSGDPDPAAEERMLRAEGQIRLLEGQLKAMGTERDKLARHIAEQAKAKEPKPDPAAERRTQQLEQEAIGLRAELEGAQTELALTRRELESLRSAAGRSHEVEEDLDAAHVEVLHTRESLEGAQQELAAARSELEDARREMRALRADEARVAVLGEELRTARAEIDDLKASHAAELVEREAELEAGVRRAREEFQRQFEELEAQAARQLAEREAALSGEATAREATLAAEAAEREATLLGEAAARESRLAEELASTREELQRRAAGSEEQAAAARDEIEAIRASLDSARAELQAARDEIDAAVQDDSSQNAQLAKANEELVRSKTEIETLQRELEEAARRRDQAELDSEAIERERESLQAELAAASAEVQTELGRGVELAERADRAERELRSSVERVTALEEERAALQAEREELSTSLAGVEARHAAELAAMAAESQPDPEGEQILRSTQERLATQTEKLIEVEERARSAERQFADAVVKLEEVEAELRHLQMEKALHDMQSEPRSGESADQGVGGPPFEDRRASTPFVKELSLDAKKTLTQILGLTQVMKYKKDSKEQAQLIKQLTAAARRLDHTVADIADSDALARGSIELTIKRIDLEALVKRVVEESGAGVDHDVRIDAEPLVVGVDAHRTEQILAGMIRTAAARTANGKAITVRAKNIEGGALLSVEDPEPSSDVSLGPVVQRFVEVQGGWTRIESREGGGSAFRVFLPDGGPSADVPGGSAEDEAAAPPEPGGDAPGTLQIMVAEPTAEAAAGSWGESEEQLLVQELHRLHAED